MDDAERDDDYADYTSCAICLEDYEGGQHVVTISCGHRFHGTCLQLWTTAATTEPTCPCCRGVLNIRSNIIWIVEQDPEEELDPEGTLEEEGGDDWWEVDGEAGVPPHTPPPTASTFQIDTPQEGQVPDLPGATPARSSSSIFATPDSQFSGPWWPVQQDTQGVYHTGTRLPDGRLGLLLDTGAWDNITGSEWANAVEERAAQHGHRARREQMARPLEIQGVGNGTQKCEVKAVLPIALPRSSGAFSLNEYHAPVIPNSPVPGLLGLRSMKSRRTIIDTINNKTYMCGPGEVQIIVPPGTEIYDCVSAPSGHMLLPVSDYDSLRRYEEKRDRLEAPPEPVVLPVINEHPQASTSSSSSSAPAALPGPPSCFGGRGSPAASSSRGH